MNAKQLVGSTFRYTIDGTVEVVYTLVAFDGKDAVALCLSVTGNPVTVAHYARTGAWRQGTSRVIKDIASNGWFTVARRIASHKKHGKVSS